MDTPVTFDWKIRLPDVLGVLRRDYAGRFPQLASAALETLLERLRDDLPEDFLPALGQELESLGLALVERLDEDDSLNLYVVGATHSRRLFDALAAQGHNARTLRQEDAPEGARAALPAAAPFFEWREARIQPLPFPVGKDLPADPAQPTSAAPGTIVWLERETLCEGRLDSGEIRSHSLDGLAEGPYLKLQALDGGWLLLAPWLEPHRSRDLAQLWHLESGRALRIRYGELDLEGGLQHWAELPDGRIVVGDHARHVDLGRFESLRQRLLRRRLAPA